MGGWVGVGGWLSWVGLRWVGLEAQVFTYKLASQQYTGEKPNAL